MNITFGEYLTNKRKEKEMSLRMLAKELDISPAYLSDVENNRRNALSYEKLQKVIEILKLDEEEQRELYDLAGKAKDTIPADVEEFVKENCTGCPQCDSGDDWYAVCSFCSRIF